MPTVPLRNLGQFGVITDVDPLLLPPAAFTMAVNARFENNGISRGPVFSLAGQLTHNNLPRYAYSYLQMTGVGVDKYLIANDDGTVTSWSTGGPGSPSIETDVTAPGWVPESYVGAYTGTLINDVYYLNRPDRVPWYVSTEGTQLAAFTNANCGWDPSWRCQALRSIAGQLVALNVTKNGVNYPTMVKTSDYMVYGALPDTWVGSATNSASENIISDMPEALIDGLVLRDRMMLYSLNYTWIMEPTYNSNVFAYQRLFKNAGMINQNCAIEYNNEHFVFGNDDLWKHDGFQKTSIAAGKIRDFVFNNLVRTQAFQFFVYQNSRLNEVMFFYVSQDPYCAFPVGGSIGYPGCNRVASYNYLAGTWQFYDTPYVTSAALGISDVNLSYTQEGTLPYTSIVGAYSNFADTSRLAVMCTSPSVGSVVSGVRTFERITSTFASGVVDTASNGPVLLQNNYIDIDQVASEIRGYKVISSVYPNARFQTGNTPLLFSFGSADYANSPLPAYGIPMSYDGAANYKLDYMTAGRYLSVKVTYSGTSDFLFTGIDLDVSVTGRR